MRCQAEMMSHRHRTHSVVVPEPEHVRLQCNHGSFATVLVQAGTAAQTWAWQLSTGCHSTAPAKCSLHAIQECRSSAAALLCSTCSTRGGSGGSHARGQQDSIDDVDVALQPGARQPDQQHLWQPRTVPIAECQAASGLLMQRASAADAKQLLVKSGHLAAGNVAGDQVGRV